MAIRWGRASQWERRAATENSEGVGNGGSGLVECVLLDEDRPDAGSVDTTWTTRRGFLRGKPSCNQAIEAQAHECVIFEDLIGNLRKLRGRKPSPGCSSQLRRHFIYGATVAVDDGGRAGGEPPAGSPLRGTPDAGYCRGLHRATVLCAGHALLRSRPRHELARSRRRGAAPPEARRLARASAARGVHWRS